MDLTEGANENSAALRRGDGKAPWEGRFERILMRCVGEERCRCLLGPFLMGFGEDYRVRTEPAAAVRDCLNIEALGSGRTDVLDLHIGPAGAHRDRLQWITRQERPLDECLPLIEHSGLRVLDQVQFVAELGGGAVYVRSFAVAARRIGALPLRRARARLIEALGAVLNGRAANDALNELVISSGLAWHDADILRAYCNYCGQLGGPMRRRQAERALIHHPATARLLFHYFEARFNPTVGSSELRHREEYLLEPLRIELAAALNSVAEVGEDRALRDLFNLIDATLRTNAYHCRDGRDSGLAIKIDSFGVIDMAMPRPAYEIYVHAADFEGIHLRGAKVARGGIRWSDRHEDLRNEILHLQQTQMIKNALIVPQGAKGGFVLKQSPADTEARSVAGQHVYRRFIRSLLEVTDRAPNGLSPTHASVLAYDESDPYLVVAADKGTAGFSDMANEVSEEQGFWLADAFASGGSRGFSHKRFGITARGAWECVRRHFRELNRDLDRERISVVGIGSMDGDVFGNGMLLSQNIRLLGAFSAHHIFLDPDPDAAQSFHERQRLFELPGSTWDCYDRALISQGGGVFPRSAKQIRLAPEVRNWLGVRYETIDGEGLVRMLLAAPVDLLWFGGIGTYVKGADETDEAVGDHGNDAVRVEASQLRAQVIGEGANLGLTQQARIEYALRGGRINMDALDNSAGVDLSDHEVNLKILLRQLMADGLITDTDRRDALLQELAPEVCASVLGHNASQSLSVSLDQLRCRREPEAFLMLAERWENSGVLDRERVEMPARSEILSRADPSLTRPELTVLLARSKLALKSLLSLARGVLQPAEFADLYDGYFPLRIRTSFGEQLIKHPLAYEITVSQICNTVIDRAGVSFLTWLEEPTPELMGRAVLLYRLFDRVLGATEQWEAIRMSVQLPPEMELERLLAVEDALALLCRWGLRNGRRVQLDDQSVSRWCEDWAEYRGFMAIGVAEDPRRARPAGHQPAGNGAAIPSNVPGDTIPALEWVVTFPWVVEFKRRSGCSMYHACEVYLAVAAWFGWPQLAGQLVYPSAHDRDRRARRAIGERLLESFCRLSLGAIRSADTHPAHFLEHRSKRGQLTRVGQLRRELAAAPVSATLEILIVLVADAEAAADECLDLLEDF